MPIPPPEAALTQEQIIQAAEAVLRRFGPAKATVVDVARVLGVSHAAVYRHVATKAELRDLVVGRWVEVTMGSLREIVVHTGPAPERLHSFFVTLFEIKRNRAAADPELFSTYRTFAAEAKSVVTAHVEELVGLVSTIIRAGIEEGAFRPLDPTATARAILLATSRFHHPLHATEWLDPDIDAMFAEVWNLLMNGLSAHCPLSHESDKVPNARPG